VHGWGGSGKSLQNLADKLERDYPESLVLNLELPGFGQTQLDHEFHLQDYAFWLSRRISESYQQMYFAANDSNDASDISDGPFGSEITPEELPKLVLIGHSVGGKIILELMDQLTDTSAGDTPFDEAVRRAMFDAHLVLIASSGIKPIASFKRLLFKLVTIPYQPVKFLLLKLGLGDLEMLVRKVFYKFVVRARDYEKLRDNQVLKSTFKNILAQDLDMGRVSLIRNRTLLIWGENDTVTPVWMGEKLDNALPNSGLVIVPGQTHGLPIKSPDEVAELIEQFLGSLEI
jgi:pimeloyl-ACP methyl ester carboxylesterase